MKKRFKTLFVCFVVINSVYSQIIIDNPNIYMKIENDAITSIKNKLVNKYQSWHVDSCALYLMEVNSPNVIATLNVSSNTENQVELVLTIKNNSASSVDVSTVFPYIKGLYFPPGLNSNLYYLYPKQGHSYSNVDVKYDCAYSRWFQMQFMDVYDKYYGGFYLLTDDRSNYPKRYFLEKKSGKIDMKVTYQVKTLQPGETWVLPTAIIGTQANDWHDALAAYKQRLTKWHQPKTPRKDWFRDIYNFRQVFLHTNFGEKGAWNPLTKNIDILSRIEEDKNVFGGVDYVHIFDWMREPEDRIYNYEPWNYLGGDANLRNQISALQNQGIKVGFYYQGYKINKHSRIGKLSGSDWQIRDTLNNPQGDGVYLYPCAYVEPWQNYLSNLILNTTNSFNLNGAYVDVFGIGLEYQCYSPLHGHPSKKGKVINNFQVQGEGNMLQKIKNTIPESVVLYDEEMPSDVSTQYLDGSFTSSVRNSKGASNNPSGINLARFAFPDFKLFEILAIDRPVGEDTLGVKKVFFNGSGLWIAGPLNDSGWFPESVRKLIRKTYSILNQNKEAFRSTDPVPLVPTVNSKIHANYFPSPRKNIWTLFNTTDQTVSSTILRIPHIVGAYYYDAWNYKRIYPAISNNDSIATISMSILGNDAGCIIQSLDPMVISPPVDPGPQQIIARDTIYLKTTSDSITLKIAASGTGSVYIDWGNGNPIKEYVDNTSDTISRNINFPTVLSKNVSNNDTIKIYTKNRYITYFDCSNNKLSYLDVSKAPMVQYLRCYTNNLTGLNVSNNLELIDLRCFANKLSNLNVSNNHKLTNLQLGTNNISSMEGLNNLYALKNLSTMLNPLSSIDLSGNPLLEVLNVRNSSLRTLDVSENPNLYSIDIYNTGPAYKNEFSASALDSLYSTLADRTNTNQGIIRVIYTDSLPLFNDGAFSLKNIATNKNWKVSDYNGNPIKTLPVLMQTSRTSGSNVTLQVSGVGSGKLWINWGDNQLSPYSVSSSVNNPTLITGTIQKDSADIKIYSDSTEIIYLDCGNNDLSSLDVSRAPMMQYLRCDTNALTGLNVANNSELILLPVIQINSQV